MLPVRNVRLEFTLILCLWGDNRCNLQFDRIIKIIDMYMLVTYVRWKFRNGATYAIQGRSNPIGEFKSGCVMDGQKGSLPLMNLIVLRFCPPLTFGLHRLMIFNLPTDLEGAFKDKFNCFSNTHLKDFVFLQLFSRFLTVANITSLCLDQRSRDPCAYNLSEP